VELVAEFEYKGECRACTEAKSEPVIAVDVRSRIGVQRHEAHRAERPGVSAVSACGTFGDPLPDVDPDQFGIGLGHIRDAQLVKCVEELHAYGS
jgi:hypothetical protein